MKPYLIVQYPYEFIDIALCSDGKVISSIQEDKKNSVKLTIPHIETLLNQKKLSLCDLDFIGVNTGPGPYNTLRALITTANGISYAKQTKLVSLSALDLLLSEHNQPTATIFNAFAGNVFYAFNTPTNKNKGYCSIDAFIQVAKKEKLPISLVGNGVNIYQEKISEYIGNVFIIPKNFSNFNSIETLAKHAFERFKQNDIVYNLEPEYLQSPVIK